MRARGSADHGGVMDIPQMVVTFDPDEKARFAVAAELDGEAKAVYLAGLMMLAATKRWRTPPSCSRGTPAPSSARASRS
jgi:hypothetical protein